MGAQCPFTELIYDYLLCLEFTFFCQQTISCVVSFCFRMLPNIKTSAAKVTRPAQKEMMLMLLYLLCCVPAVKTCLQCDGRIRRLHENFILSAPTIADQIELKKICDHAYNTYKEASQKRKGIIGEAKLWLSNTLNLGFGLVTFKYE